MLPGTAGILSVTCDMTTDGGGWTKFNWVEGPYPTTFPEITDFDPLELALDHESCVPSSSVCRGRIPAGATALEILVVATADSQNNPFPFGVSKPITPAGTKAVWKFDGTRISDAILAALRTRTAADVSRLQGETAFTATYTDGSPQGCTRTDACDRFKYDGNGITFGTEAAGGAGSISWSNAAFKIGRTALAVGDSGYLGEYNSYSHGALFYR